MATTAGAVRKENRRIGRVFQANTYLETCGPVLGGSTLDRLLSKDTRRAEKEHSHIWGSKTGKMADSTWNHPCLILALTLLGEKYPHIWMRTSNISRHGQGEIPRKLGAN